MNLPRLAVGYSARITRLISLALVLFGSVYPGSVLAQAPPKTNRKVIVRVEPDYPDFFRNGHFEGRIVAEVTVLPNGSVSNVDIKAGNPMFASFAAKALMKWKYAPSPDKTLETVIVNFTSTPH